MAFRNSERVTVTIRNADIVYRNFRGEKTQYNTKGNRNFSVVLSEQQASEMLQDGWNVKTRVDREETGEPFYTLQVKVNFDYRPPRCYLITSNNRTMLIGDMTAIFDQLDYERIDLTIVAYDYNVNGNTGRAAYLESFYFTAYESELESEYSHIPVIPVLGDSSPKEIEAGARLPYDREDAVVVS